MNERPRAAECISKIESAFAPRLSGGALKIGQCNLLADMFLQWSDVCVIDVTEKVISQYDSFPSVAEFLRLKREWSDVQTKPTGPIATPEQLAKGGAPWWFTMTAKLQAKGMKMSDIGDAILAEAKRRNVVLPHGLYLGAGRTS